MTLLLGALGLALALINFSTPIAQMLVSGSLLVIGIAGAGVLFRAIYPHNKMVVGFEIFLLLIVVVLAAGELIDVGTHWPEWRSRQ